MKVCICNKIIKSSVLFILELKLIFYIYMKLIYMKLRLDNEVEEYFLNIIDFFCLYI